MTSYPRSGKTPTVHATTLADLIMADLLMPGEELVSMRPSWPACATLNADGSISYNGQIYPALSAAARAVREGRAANGWGMWAVERHGKLMRLTQVREVFENR